MRLAGRKSLLLGISLIMSFIGALGAGVMLGTGLNWWLFAVFAAMAIWGSVIEVFTPTILSSLMTELC